MRGPATHGLDGRLGCAISLPDTWFELELRPGLREPVLADLVDRRSRAVPELRPHRHTLLRLLEQQAAAAWDAGATYAGAFALPMDDGLATGSMTISLLEDPFASSEDLHLVDRFAEVPRGPDPTAPWAVSSVVDIPGAGVCARSVGIDDAEVEGGGLIRHVFALTAVPVRDLERVFLLSFGSPVLPLADALHDLFDAVAGTFRVIRTEVPDPEES